MIFPFKIFFYMCDFKILCKYIQDKFEARPVNAWWWSPFLYLLFLKINLDFYLGILIGMWQKIWKNPRIPRMMGLFKILGK